MRDHLLAHRHDQLNKGTAVRGGGAGGSGVVDHDPASDGAAQEKDGDVSAPFVFVYMPLRARVRKAAAMLVLYLLGWCLLVLSWKALYHQMKLLRGAVEFQQMVLGCISIALACACYTTWGLLAQYGPPPGATECARRFHAWRGSSNNINNVNSSKGMLGVVGGSRRRTLLRLTTALRSVMRARHGLVLFPSVGLLAAYTIVDMVVPSQFAQTKVIVLGTTRAIWDGMTVYVITTILLAQAAGLLLSSSSLSSKRTAGAAASSSLTLHPSACSTVPGCATLLLIACLTLMAAGQFLEHVGSIDTLETMRGTVLGVPGRDFCQVYGLELDPERLQGSVVLPEILPRRFFNFYMGREICREADHVQLGFIDEVSELLVVPTKCPTSRGLFAKSRAPRVYLETPFNNELNGQDADVLPSLRESSKEFHQSLEDKYRMDDSVIIHRTKTGGVIHSVEMKPETLTPTLRPPASKKEKHIRDKWVGDEVFAIPLGRSLMYTVRCDLVDMEEYFIYPLAATTSPKSARSHDGSANDGANHNHHSSPAEPPANVLMLFFDAVSRPEFLRTMPRLARWLREFHRGGTAHRVLEARSHTTLGHSTSGNLAPLLTGTTARMLGDPDADFASLTIFQSVKERYGSLVQTSLLMGYCQDVLEGIFGKQQRSAGNGEPSVGLDHYMFAPMCHLQYSALESNLQGPYSIRQRCMGSFHAHEHLLAYTRGLLRQRLRDMKAHLMETAATGDDGGGSSHKGGKNSGRFFLDMAQLIEGHEGSHSVLTLIDEAVVEFMEELRTDLHFFDDPRNAVVLLSDHGNHMGPYFLMSEAGKLERTMPFLIFMIHPETFKRVDRFRGWAEGSAEMAMTQRVRRVSTQVDLYMTLCDLVGVEPHVSPVLTSALSPPQSLFDPATAAEGHKTFFDRYRIPHGGQDLISTHWCINTTRDK